MNLQYITNGFLKRYKRRVFSAEHINNGDCYRWARLAKRLHGGRLVSVSVFVDFGEGFQLDSGHAFIKINDKYFDSESPNGVDQWKKLHFFQRVEQWIAERRNIVGLDYKHDYGITIHKSVSDFQSHWISNKAKERADESLLDELKKEKQNVYNHAC